MVKKVIILILIFSISLFSKVIIINKTGFKLDINSDLFYKSNDFVVINIFSVEKELVQSKKVEFYPDRYGNYIYYNGDYYYTSNHQRYTYNPKYDRFIVDNKYGQYVYASHFYWARNEKQKYIKSSFYKKYEKTIKEEYYYISGYVVEISYENLFLKSFTPFVFKVRSLSDINQQLMNLNKNLNKFYPDKIDIVVDFDEKIPEKLKAFLLANLQEDNRYNIYDRKYLYYIFEELRLRDLIGKNAEIKFRVPEYIISVKNISNYHENTTQDELLFFRNDMNGQYLSNGYKVEVGKYYSFDGKNYIPDRENGNYVKILNFIWKKERYTTFSNFYDVISVDNLKYTNIYYSILLNVIETKTARVIFSKYLEKTLHFPEIRILDRFKSYETESKIDSLLNLYKSFSSDIKNLLKKAFPLSSMVKNVEKLNVELYDGENIGIKRGQVFRISDDHWTEGYLKITNVFATSSSGDIFYLLDEKIEKFSLASEAFEYPLRVGISTMIGLSNFEEYYLLFNIRNLDIKGNDNFSVGFGIFSDYYTFEISKRIWIFDAILRLYFKEESFEFLPALRINTAKKYSLFSNEIFGFFLDISQKGFSSGIVFGF